MQTPQQQVDNLKLVDKNIRNSKQLVSWRCELCERKLYYPAHAPIPQCPYCSTQGEMARMKRYYGGLTIVTS